MSDLRPMALGEIVDRSTAFWRQHWRPMYGLFVAFQLVQYVLLKAWQLAMQTWFPDSQGQRLLDLGKTDPTEALGQMGVSVGSLLVVMLTTFFVSQVAGVAATGFIYPRLTGQAEPSIRDALRRARARLGPTTGVFALSMLWAGVVFVLTQLPALGLFGVAFLMRDASPGAIAALAIFAVIASFAGILFLALWFIMRFVLVAQVVAMEDVSALAAFRRTGVLSSGRVAPGFDGLVKVRLTVLITVVGAILLLVSALTGIPQFVLQGVYGSGFGAGALVEPPQYLLVPAELFQILAGSIVSPLYVVFQVVFYVDMRIRREGLDLELKLKEAKT